MWTQLYAALSFRAKRIALCNVWEQEMIFSLGSKISMVSGISRRQAAPRNDTTSFVISSPTGEKSLRPRYGGIFGYRDSSSPRGSSEWRSFVVISIHPCGGEESLIRGYRAWLSLWVFVGNGDPLLSSGWQEGCHFERPLWGWEIPITMVWKINFNLVI